MEYGRREKLIERRRGSTGNEFKEKKKKKKQELFRSQFRCKKKKRSNEKEHPWKTIEQQCK